MRLLVLLTDAFGGRGGVAHHNRLLLGALCSAPGVQQVVALPRLIVDPVEPLPDRLAYQTEAAGSKWTYARAVLKLAASREPFDAVVCGHLNLLPFAALLARRFGAPLVQVVHGIDAWTPPGQMARRLTSQIDVLVSVSDFTLQKMRTWADLSGADTVVIPNGIDLSKYGPGPRRPDLVVRYGLAGRRVVLTLGRMSASERYKGHDEILEALPALARQIPEVTYLVAGSGDDQPRLAAKAEQLGVADRVVWAGYVPDDEKTDTLRLADVFAMPGRGEGFGIVYLEALACGVSVIASTADASREAVLDGALGAVVDPSNGPEILRALVDSLRCPRVSVGAADLEAFSVAAFSSRWHAVVYALHHA